MLAMSQDIIIEGKTKIVYKIPDQSGNCLIVSKDVITAHDGSMKHDLEGKAAVSTKTNGLIYEYLNSLGIRTSFVKLESENSYVARNCHMIPIEWVTRQLATGSFVRRNPGVPEGFRFSPPKQETFYKDDAQHDPLWSSEELLAAALTVGGRRIDANTIARIAATSLAVFEILAAIFEAVDCVLIDMKVEFGVDTETGEILLSDVIDCDSWRIWPRGDKRLQKDKQVYRDMQTQPEVSAGDLAGVLSDFQWVATRLSAALCGLTDAAAGRPGPAGAGGRVVVFSGSASDGAHVDAICQELRRLGLPATHCHRHVASAHKATEYLLKLVAGYESMGKSAVFIAVAGRSNGLGPVLAGNTSVPVINCPPIDGSVGALTATDVWSSLRLPSGLACATVLGAATAAQAACQILAGHPANRHMWIHLRVNRLRCALAVLAADEGK